MVVGTTGAVDFVTESLDEVRIVADQVVAIRRLTDHIRRTQKTAFNAHIKPVAVHVQLPGEAVDGPPAVDLFGEAVLMITTDPVMPLADFQYGRGREGRTPGRAKALGAELLG